MDTGRFVVDSQVDMATWREVRVFLFSSGFNSTLSEDHNTKLHSERTFLALGACFTSTVLDGKVGVK